MKHELPIATEVRPAVNLANLATAINAEHVAGDAMIQKGILHYRQAGKYLIEAKEACGHGNWLSWVKKNVRFEYRQVARYMKLAKCDVTSNLELEWSAIDGNAAPEENGEVPEEKRFLTISSWEVLKAAERQRALSPPSSEEKFNDQGDSESIGWALWSWNPVTGCLHNCPYCYARDIANRLFEPKFEPVLYPSRLNAPQNTSFPMEKAAEKPSHKNVFVCSMADLFGRWVPAEWVEAVLDRVRTAPQWNFLFLTKFPIRLSEFDFPDNAWVGTTVDCQARVANAEKAFRKVKAGKKWLSCEPLIEPLHFETLEVFDWLVIGGASASTETPAWVPPRAWIEQLHSDARKAGLRVYLKRNSGILTQEFLWDDPTEEATEAPAALRYLIPKDQKA